MNAKKKVLLLGDSIRMSYQPIVAELLGWCAEVVGPAENCQFSAYTLANLDRWLGEIGKPHIVHWNNGLHDVGRNPARTPVHLEGHASSWPNEWTRQSASLQIFPQS